MSVGSGHCPEVLRDTCFLYNALLEYNFVAAFAYLLQPYLPSAAKHMHVNISTYITSALFCTLRT